MVERGCSRSFCPSRQQRHITPSEHIRSERIALPTDGSLSAGRHLLSVAGTDNVPCRPQETAASGKPFSCPDANTLQAVENTEGGQGRGRTLSSVQAAWRCTDPWRPGIACRLRNLLRSDGGGVRATRRSLPCEAGLFCLIVAWRCLAKHRNNSSVRAMGVPPLL